MATWLLTGFNWTRYRALAPILREAARAQDLRQVRDSEAAELIAGLDDHCDIASACNYVIAELCSIGNGLKFRGTFPALVRYLEATDGGEEAAEKLAEGAFAGLNVEEWFRAELGLMGILSWADLDRLRAHLNVPHHSGKSEGGVLNLVRLLRTGETPEELAEALLRLVDECLDRGWGLAFILQEA